MRHADGDDDDEEKHLNVNEKLKVLQFLLPLLLTVYCIVNKKGRKSIGNYMKNHFVKVRSSSSSFGMYV